MLMFCIMPDQSARRVLIYKEGCHTGSRGKISSAIVGVAPDMSEQGCCELPHACDALPLAWCEAYRGQDTRLCVDLSVALDGYDGVYKQVEQAGKDARKLKRKRNKVADAKYAASSGGKSRTSVYNATIGGRKSNAAKVKKYAATPQAVTADARRAPAFALSAGQLRKVNKSAKLGLTQRELQPGFTIDAKR